MKQGKHYTTVILWILLIAIAAYFGYSVVTSIHQPLTTATVMDYEAGSGYYAAGFVVRDETVIESEYGITVLTAKEGARVAAGEPVATGYLTGDAQDRQSRITELNEMHGAYSESAAALDHQLHMLGLKTDSMLELRYTDRKRIHNLKYYTWVEQQGKTSEELNALWYDVEGTWDAVHAQAKDLDALINEFNEETGLLKSL